VNFKNQGENLFVAQWNPFMVNDGLISDDINLYMEYTNEGDLVAYPFLGDQRFRGFWAESFKQKGNTLYFEDGNGGFNFQAELQETHVDLSILLLDQLITKTRLTFAPDGWDYNNDFSNQTQSTETPEQMNDGWKTANISDFGIRKQELSKLIEDVRSNKLVNIHSVLISKRNTLVFEAYFHGHNANIPHDLRSASKSISSAVIGIAIDEGILENTDQKLYDLLPEKWQYTKNERKEKITLQHLLTMSSGLDVNNQASENYYQDTRNSNNWLKTVLTAPMVKEPGTYLDYGSANPFLLGVVLNEQLDVPMENYMDEKLFAPLEITNYINQTDDTKEIPYFGGGMLLTSRDLLKFGQLFLNNGKWNGKQVISEKWVEASFGKCGRLQDARDKNEYGYLWWHDGYQVKGTSIKTIEARGAGGQFIFLVPQLETVVVITAGNFRNRKGNLSREIFEQYILPAML
jgi:CubicO group peptidase (beta-lactamase class C family)